MNKLMMGVTVAIASTGTTAQTAYWFDSDLNRQQGDGLLGFATPAAAAASSFTNDVSYGGGVLDFDAAFGAQGTNGLFFDTGAFANGGGDYINNYTIVFDVRVNSGFNWLSFWQTNDSNSNDGDLFVNPDGGIGISADYNGTISGDTWHRVAFVFGLFDDNGTTSTALLKFIDGTLAGAQNLGSGVDGRWSLYPTDDTFFNGAYLFADNSGDMSDAAVGAFLFDDRAWSVDEIAALGGASYGTLGVVPAPGAVALLGSAAAVGMRRRR